MLSCSIMIRGLVFVTLSLLPLALSQSVYVGKPRLCVMQASSETVSNADVVVYPNATWSNLDHLLFEPFPPARDFLGVAAAVLTMPQQGSAYLACTAFCSADGGGTKANGVPRDAIVEKIEVKIIAAVDSENVDHNVGIIGRGYDSSETNPISSASASILGGNENVSMAVLPTAYDLSEQKLINAGFQRTLSFDVSKASLNMFRRNTVGVVLVLGPNNAAESRKVGLFSVELHLQWKDRGIGSKRGLGLVSQILPQTGLQGVRFGNGFEGIMQPTAYQDTMPEPPPAGDIRWMAAAASPKADYQSMLTVNVNGGKVLLFRKEESMGKMDNSVLQIGNPNPNYQSVGLRFLPSGNGLLVHSINAETCSGSNSAIGWSFYNPSTDWTNKGAITQFDFDFCSTLGDVNVLSVKLAASTRASDPDAALLGVCDSKMRRHILLYEADTDWNSNTNSRFTVQQIGAAGPASLCEDWDMIFSSVTSSKMIVYGTDGDGGTGPTFYYMQQAPGPNADAWGTATPISVPVANGCIPLRVKLTAQLNSNNVLVVVQCQRDQLQAQATVWWAVFNGDNWVDFGVLTQSLGEGNPDTWDIVAGVWPAGTQTSPIVLISDLFASRAVRVFTISGTGSWVQSESFEDKDNGVTQDIVQSVKVALDPFGLDLVATLVYSSSFKQVLAWRDNELGTWTLHDAGPSAEFAADFLFDQHLDPACPTPNPHPPNLPARELSCPPPGNEQCKTAVNSNIYGTPMGINCEVFENATSLDGPFNRETSCSNDGNGNIIRTWSGCGPLNTFPYNVAPPVLPLGRSCQQTVIIRDTVKPVARCKSLINVTMTGTMALLSGSQVNDGSSDNCVVAGLGLLPNQFSCSAVGGLRSTTLTVTDGGCNSDSCQANVRVFDMEPPVASCVSSLEVNVGPSEGGIVLIEPLLLNQLSSDNCGPLSFQVSPPTVSCANLSASGTAVLTVNDPSGNLASCVSNIITRDRIDPIARCMSAEQVVVLNSGGTAIANPSQFDDNSSDNCGITERSTMPSFFGCADTRMTSVGVTLAVFDSSGNSGLCTATARVLDRTQPVVTCPVGPVEIACGAIEAGELDGTFEFSANDECTSLSNLQITRFPNVLPTECGIEFVRRIVARDESGNDGQCNFTIQVPLGNSDATCPPTAFAACNDPLSVLEADQVGGLGNFTNCNFRPRVLDESVPACGNTRVVRRRLSACGTSCNQTIITEDRTPPQFEQCPLVTVSIICADLASYQFVTPTVTEDCGNVTVDFTDSAASACGSTWSRRWIATSECGNSSTCPQLVQVSPAGCVKGFWGGDCSCSAPPPKLGATCSEGSWSVVGDLTMLGTLELGYDTIIVSGQLTLDSGVSSNFGPPLADSGPSSRKRAVIASTGQRHGFLRAGCVVMRGSVSITMYSSSVSSVPIIQSGCPMQEIFEASYVSNSSGMCESFTNYQLPSTDDLKLQIVVIPITDDCPPPTPWGLIMGLVFGLGLGLILVTAVTIYCIGRHRQKKMLSELQDPGIRLRAISTLGEISTLEMAEECGEDIGIDSLRNRRSKSRNSSLREQADAKAVPELFESGVVESRDRKGNYHQALSPRHIIERVQELKRTGTSDNVARRAKELRAQGATLRGKTIEGMTDDEQKALHKADDAFVLEPELEELYRQAIKRKRLRFWTRLFVILLTLGGAALAGYAVADFVQFTALTSSQEALSRNESEILRFFPPDQWLDLAVRSQCGVEGGLCYEPVLQLHAQTIAGWSHYLIGHQPEADLTILTNIIISSLALDFFSLLILGVAIAFAVMESRGKLPKKFSRPKVECCNTSRRWDIFLWIDIFLFAGSALLLVASIIIAFTIPLVLVPTNTVEQVQVYEVIEFNDATQSETIFYFFKFVNSLKVSGEISNFQEIDPEIRFRPYVRNRGLSPTEYQRHVQYIRSLNSVPLSAARQEQCAAAFEESNAFQLPATCDNRPEVECKDNCCVKAGTPENPEQISSCDCQVDEAGPNLRCCRFPADGGGTVRECGFLAVYVPPTECRRPKFTPPDYCLAGLDDSRDPPLGALLKPSLWTICPYDKILFRNTSVLYNCTGSAVVQLNATDALKELVQDQIVQGIGVDAAATGLDGVGALLEHFLMPYLFKPIVLI